MNTWTGTSSLCLLQSHRTHSGTHTVQRRTALRSSAVHTQQRERGEREEEEEDREEEGDERAQGTEKDDSCHFSEAAQAASFTWQTSCAEKGRQPSRVLSPLGPHTSSRGSPASGSWPKDRQFLSHTPPAGRE